MDAQTIKRLIPADIKVSLFSEGVDKLGNIIIYLQMRD